MSEFQKFAYAAWDTKRNAVLLEIIFFPKHLYGPEVFSAKTDREGAGMAVCAWPRISHCHSCLCITAWSQGICIPANAASSSAGPVDTMALGKQLACCVLPVSSG